MKSQRNAIRYLFSLILAASILPVGFAPSGYTRGRQFIPSLAAPAAVQSGGASWKPVNTGLSNLNVGALAIDPINPATIYAGTNGGGMFKSTDGGATWNLAGVTRQYIKALAVNPLNPSIVYYGADTDGGNCSSMFPLFKSTNGGAFWSNQNSPADCDISLIVIDPTSPNTLYAGSENEYFLTGGIILWKSTDGGATWHGGQTGNIGLASYGLTVHPTNSQILYAPGDLYNNNGNTTDSGIFKSTDGGLNWSATGLTGASLSAVAIDPFNPSTIYAGGDDNGIIPLRGMLKSTDGGANWFAINTGLPYSSISRVVSIVVDRDNPSVLYIGTSSDGVFKSTDGGASWHSFNDGWVNLEIRVLALAPGNPNTLYAGTNGGVFKITDNAQATNPIDDPTFFVSQHYRDFLSREAEPSGLQGWLSILNNCAPGSPLCDRIEVSSAFFRSQEFRDRGYFVYKLYAASLGRNPAFPHYAEFFTDLAKVSGFLTDEQLDARKTAFAEEFITRSEFQTRYNGTTNQQYVDLLLQSAGVTLSAALRDGWIAALNAQTKTRAQVLRELGETTEVDQKYYVQSFVVMQYFGYLRRDPDGLYLSWITTMQADPNNYRQMVNGFMNSIEYRSRFGTP